MRRGPCCQNQTETESSLCGPFLNFAGALIWAVSLNDIASPPANATIKAIRDFYVLGQIPTLPAAREDPKEVELPVKWLKAPEDCWAEAVNTLFDFRTVAV